MSYQHLSEKERYVISHLQYSFSIREIARRLGRHHSTISREFKRAKARYPRATYYYDWSHPLALERRQQPRHLRRQNNKRLLRYFALFGALAGFTGGLGFTIFTALDWPLNTGGKPIVSLPPFLITAYLMTILFGFFFLVEAMFAGLALAAINLFFQYRFKQQQDPAATARHQEDLGRLLLGFSVLWGGFFFAQPPIVQQDRKKAGNL